MRATELCKLAGCTYRQLDYWCREEIVELVVSAKGSGTQRAFDPAIIPKVMLLADISKAFHGNPSPGLLRQVYENYDKGRLYLGGGVELIWNEQDQNDLKNLV